MWILSIGVVITILQYAESAATDVVFTCDSCKDKGSSLTGEVGGNLSFFVTVNKASFTSLKINYNATSPIVCTPSIINTNKVTDNRFIIPNTPTKTANKWSMKITLTKLSIADNNAEFTYTYTDAAADEHSGKQVVTVHVGPSLHKQLENEYTVEIANKFHLNFSLMANPLPSEVSASFGSQSLTVNDVGRDPKKYLYHYQIDGGFLKKELCGSQLKIKAVGLKTILFTADVKLSFIPDIPQGLTANRDDKTKELEITWTGLEYGTCLVRYHVRYTNQNQTTVDHITRTPKYNIKGAIGNISVAVNAEVNGKTSPFGEKVIFSVTTVPTKPKPGTGEKDEAFALEYIIAIVVVVTLILIIIMGLCILKRKKGKMSENQRYDVDMQPLSHGGAEPENEYAEVNSFSPSKPQPPQMIYAELGPTGGRTGEKPVIEQSNYAQVKTEGVHYPNLQQTSQYRPTYGVSSRNQRQPSASNDYDDASFGHESSIVV